MFYKYFYKILFFFLCILFLGVTTVLLEDISYGSPNPHQTTVPTHWRDTTNDSNFGTVPFDVNWYLVGHPNWCDTNHVTDHCDVKYEHFYVLENWPQDGHTASEAKFYFDYDWNDVNSTDSVGTANPKYNCFSYAFGITDCWVNAYSEIISNDYNDAEESDADICYWTSPRHAVKINEVNDCNITEIKFKDRGSAIFTYEYTEWDKKLSPKYPSTGTLKKEIP
ncbi:MAG: hypothetical protein ACYSWP_05970 [Planctomycetota bacterium]|jgi:hypothetical protein